MLQRSLLSQTEEQRRIAALEQQVRFILAIGKHSDWFKNSEISTIESPLSFWLHPSPLQILLSTKDFENERLDRQNLQHQLQKVLKELRKARDQISKLESAVSVDPAHKLALLLLIVKFEVFILYI